MPKRDEYFDTEAVVKRLDAILNVLLSLPKPDGKTMSLLRRVEILSSSGFRNVEIANILGVSQVHVGVMINRLREVARRPRRGSRSSRR